MTGDTEQIQSALAERGYIAERGVATAVHLAQRLERPLLIEGPAGVGKTEIAKVMAQVRSAELIRLQCYEGLDASTALYEWNYQKQLLHIRMQEGRMQEARSEQTTLEQQTQEIFSRDFLLERPLLKAIQQSSSPVLLIDEVDRADEAFEAFLLELLSDWQVSIPELGTLRADHAPVTVLTSNRTRELSDALRRRCLYLWIDYPPFAKELSVIQARLPEVERALAERVVMMVQLLRRLPLEKTPGVAESLDWTAALALLSRDELAPDALKDTVSVLLKHYEDQRRFRSAWLPALLSVVSGADLSEDGLEAAWQQLSAQL